jgi:uncharacterized membrane protein YfcA
MATVGLKGIWGLEQLDRTDIATWKLGLMLMGIAGVASYILSKLITGMDPNPVLETILVVFLLALARATEVDLSILALFDDAIDASIERLRPKPALRFTCVIIGLLFGFLLTPALFSTSPNTIVL